MTSEQRLRELKQELFDCNFKYSCMPVKERDKYLKEYEQERKRIRRQMALLMLKQERNDENDQYKRR